MSTHGPSRWFSFRGRAPRREFILQSAIILGLENAAHNLGAAALRAGVSAQIPVASYLLIGLLCLIANLAVIFRRLHDLGARGRGVVIALVVFTAAFAFVAWRARWEPPPVVYAIVWLAGSVLLAAVPGEAGTNRFGAPPGLRGSQAAARDEQAA